MEKAKKEAYIEEMLRRNNIELTDNQWKRTYHSGRKEDVSAKALQRLKNIFSGNYDMEIERIGGRGK